MKQLKINSSHDWELGDDEGDSVTCNACGEMLDYDDPIIDLFSECKSRKKIEQDLKYARQTVERLEKMLSELG